MPDSWIDREEFKQLVESFSPKAKKRPRPVRFRPAVSQPAETVETPEPRASAKPAEMASEASVPPAEHEADFEDAAAGPPESDSREDEPPESPRADDADENEIVVEVVETEERIAESFESGLGPATGEAEGEELVSKLDIEFEESDEHGTPEALAEVENGGLQSAPESIGGEFETVFEVVVEGGDETEVFHDFVSTEEEVDFRGEPSPGAEGPDEGSETSAIEGTEEPAYEVSAIPGLEISSPFLGEGLGESLDSIVDQDPESERPSLSEETETHVEALPGLESPDSADEPEAVLNVKVEDPSADVERPRGHAEFLTPPTEPPVSRARAESENDATKAVGVLARARDRVDRGRLIKSRESEGEKPGRAGAEKNAEWDEPSASPGATATEEPPVEFEFKPEGTFPQRLSQFADLVRTELRAEEVAVLDAEGYILHGFREGPGAAGSVDVFHLLGVLESVPRSIGLREPQASQATDGRGTWYCLVPAAGARENIVAKLELEHPLEQADLDACSKALAIALNPANALS
ncbi:MAG: hypothetical protein WD342_10455 [Verrucomicrobiales bacterium]